MLNVQINQKSYKEGTVLKNVNFSVKPGEMVMVLAPSGTGKTTLINCLAKRAKFLGRVFSSDKVINPSLVEQGFTLDPRETVIESVYYTMRLSHPKMTRKNCIYNAKRTIESLRLYHVINHKIGNLSGGQKRRVQIAQSFCKMSDILILDEPDSGLDISSADKVIKDLKNTAKETGKEVIVNSHNTCSIDSYDQVLVLSKDSGGVASIAYYGKPEYLEDYFTLKNRSMLELYEKIEEGKDEDGLYYTDIYTRLPKEIRARLQRPIKEIER